MRPAVARAGMALSAHLADRVDATFAASAAARARSPHQFSISGIGQCLRQGAYKLAGTPVDDGWAEGPKRTAELGTWLHNEFLPEFVSTLDNPDAVTWHEPVVLKAAGIEVPGEYDVHYPDSPQGPVLIDLKTAYGWSWEFALKQGAQPGYRWQSRGYATALVQQGVPVEWLAWVHLNRAKAIDWEVSEPYTVQHGLEVVKRVGAIVDAAAKPDKAPREAPGPSAALKREWSPCDSCPWLRRCWGKAVQGAAPQTAVLKEQPGGAALAAAQYDRYRAAKSAAEEGMSFNRAVLSGVPSGKYPHPDDPALSLRVGRNAIGSIQVKIEKTGPAQEAA